MAKYDYEYGKMYGVVEKYINEDVIIEPEIIERSSSFIEELLRGDGFEGMAIVLKNQTINFFPSKKLAEEFYDHVCLEKAMRNPIVVN